MIKRRFYRFEHGDKDDPSESSSSSDSESEAESSDEPQEDNVVTKTIDNDASSSSGYESEDSSADEFNLDSPVLAGDEDDSSTLNGKGSSCNEGNLVKREDGPEKVAIQFDRADCVLKYKSVFKCRVCPRIVCLSEDTLKAHLNSKKHARSERLLKEGRLKLMLNDKGQIEGDDLPIKAPAKESQGKESLKSNKRSKQEATSEKGNRPFKNREKRRRK